jgi:hypothetical protein
LCSKGEPKMKQIPWELMVWASAYYCGIHRHHQQIFVKGIQVLTPLSQNKIPYCSVLTQVPVRLKHYFYSKLLIHFKFNSQNQLMKSTYLQIYDHREKPLFQGNLWKQLKKVINMLRKKGSLINNAVLRN